MNFYTKEFRKVAISSIKIQLSLILLRVVRANKFINFVPITLVLVPICRIENNIKIRLKHEVGSTLKH